jgi:hypothetical protein
MKTSVGKIALGITDDEVPLGSHLIHFWHNDAEFERGVRFLELGIDDESQYSVLFGHDEANDRVLQILRKTGRDLDRVIREGRLVILRRESSASGTLASIDAAFSRAVGKGAIAIRYLGNLGMGQAPLPGRGADEVVELESGATKLADRYPCVIVCMYDINTVSGRLVLDGGFGTHPLAVCRGALRHNPYYPTENKNRAA